MTRSSSVLKRELFAGNEVTIRNADFMLRTAIYPGSFDPVSKAQAPVGFGSCGQDENAGCAEAELRTHGPVRFGVMISGTVN